MPVVHGECSKVGKHELQAKEAQIAGEVPPLHRCKIRQQQQEHREAFSDGSEVPSDHQGECGVLGPMSDRKLVELAGQAVNWLHAAASGHPRAAEIRRLADELFACLKGCHACGSPSPYCQCENDE